MKHITTTAVAAAVALACGGTAFGYTGQQYAGKAHVSIAAARSIALRTARGSITSEELEYERGGSGLRYTFDVTTSHGVREVGIDARTGAIVENSAESPAAEAPEEGEKGGNHSSVRSNRILRLRSFGASQR